MGNGVSTHQGNLPSHGIRDVIDAADKEQHDWSELADAPITKQPSTTLLSPRKRHSGASNAGPKLKSTEDNVRVGANVRSISDTHSSARLSATESARSTDDNQLRQRRRKSSSSSTEDGEVRAEDNGRRERRKKSSTSMETALPKSTNTHAGVSACTADQYAEDEKSTYTCDGASARPAIGRAADHHAEERTAMEEGLSFL